MTQPDDLRKRIAAVQLAHMGDDYEQDMGESPCGFKYSTLEELAAHIADAVIRELGLREETRTLNDGMGGITTNWRTGETTAHSKPATRQRRYVTDWQVAE